MPHATSATAKATSNQAIKAIDKTESEPRQIRSSSESNNIGKVTNNGIITILAVSIEIIWKMEKKQITIDFDNQPKAKEPMKGEVVRLEREAKNQIIIDFDNQPNCKEPAEGEIHRIERKP